MMVQISLNLVNIGSSNEVSPVQHVANYMNQCKHAV